MGKINPSDLTNSTITREMGRFPEKFSPDRVEKFYDRVADICNQRLKIKTSRTAQEAKENAALGDLKKTLNHLGQLANGSLYFNNTVTYKDYSAQQNERQQARDAKDEVLQDIMVKATHLRSSLSELIGMIGRFPPVTGSPGRPAAGTNNFVYSIGLAFHESFGVYPTTTPHGPFFLIVKKALAVVGLPCKDPSKKVNPAVRRIKDTKVLMMDTPHNAKFP